VWGPSKRVTQPIHTGQVETPAGDSLRIAAECEFPLLMDVTSTSGAASAGPLDAIVRSLRRRARRTPLLLPG